MFKRVTSILLVLVLAIAMVVMTGCAGSRLETMYWRLEKTFGWEYVDDEGVKDVYAPIEYYIEDVLQPRYNKWIVNKNTITYEDFLVDYEDEIILNIVLFGSYKNYIEENRGGVELQEDSFLMYYNGVIYTLDFAEERAVALIESTDYSVNARIDEDDAASLPSFISYSSSLLVSVLPLYSLRMSEGVAENISPASAYEVYIYLVTLG